MKEPKTLDEALQSLFATIEEEKRAATEGGLGGQSRRPSGREGGHTARVIDFAQWKRARQRDFTFSPRPKGE